jgi:hypothetical protein
MFANLNIGFSAIFQIPAPSFPILSQVLYFVGLIDRAASVLYHSVTLGPKRLVSKSGSKEMAPVGVKYFATLLVEFEMEDGQPENLAKIVLNREVGRLHHAIERGSEVAPTGVKPGSARVEILDQGETD